MTRLEELLEQEEKLDRERTEYLEADDNRGAKRTEKKLNQVRDLIQIERLGDTLKLKEDLDIYKKYVKSKGLENDFKCFYDMEVQDE